MECSSNSIAVHYGMAFACTEFRKHSLYPALFSMNFLKHIFVFIYYFLLHVRYDQNINYFYKFVDKLLLVDICIVVHLSLCQEKL